MDREIWVLTPTYPQLDALRDSARAELEERGLRCLVGGREGQVTVSVAGNQQHNALFDVLSSHRTVDGVWPYTAKGQTRGVQPGTPRPIQGGLVRR